MDENLPQWFPGWSFDVLIDMDSFRPLRSFDGYLPIEDHGMIGDGATAALTGRDGTIWWMCVPRFDSAPLFDSMIDARRGCCRQLGFGMIGDTKPSALDHGKIVGAVASDQRVVHGQRETPAQLGQRR